MAIVDCDAIETSQKMIIEISQIDVIEIEVSQWIKTYRCSSCVGYSVFANYWSRDIIIVNLVRKKRVYAEFGRLA